MQVIDPSIFKAYDIRGVAGENLTADVVEKIPYFPRYLLLVHKT